MKHRLVRTLIALALSTGVIISIPACNQDSEGDRCNPARAANGEDECGSGLSCQQPTNCPENYCCPTSGTSNNPYCQTGCNGGDVSICTADPTQPFCPDLCKKDPTQVFCTSASAGSSAGGGAASGGATGSAGAP
jgi:hypothetical protein